VGIKEYVKKQKKGFEEFRARQAKRAEENRMKRLQNLEAKAARAESELPLIRREEKARKKIRQFEREKERTRGKSGFGAHMDSAGKAGEGMLGGGSLFGGSGSLFGSEPSKSVFGSSSKRKRRRR